MKLTLASLTALVFAGALALPAFAQTAPGTTPDNPSSSSASSSASTSDTNNGTTTTRQNSAHEKSGTSPSGNYSERSNQQYEGKESSSMMGAPATPGESGAPANPSENTNNPPTQ